MILRLQLFKMLCNFCAVEVPLEVTQHTTQEKEGGGWAKGKIFGVSIHEKGVSKSKRIETSPPLVPGTSSSMMLHHSHAGGAIQHC